MMRKLFVVLLLIALSLIPAARAGTANIDQSSAFEKATSTWTDLAESVDEGTTVVVFEVAHPQRRRVCHVRELHADGLVCAKHFHRNVTIPAQRVVAVLDPRQKDDRTLRIWAATGGALIAAGFFAGPGAPALWVAGGLVLITWPAAAMGADNGLEHDLVLYYAPGPRPQLPLQ